MIVELYYHIQSLEQNAELLKGIISSLKETIVKNSIQLPELAVNQVLNIL